MLYVVRIAKFIHDYLLISGISVTNMPGKTVELTQVQKLIGKRMLQSKREIPCFYLEAKADMTNLVAFRKGRCRKAGIRAGTNDFIIKTIGNSIYQYALMAGQVVGDETKIADSVNVGLAVDTPGGRVVPVIKDVHKKNLKDIATDSKQLTQKARMGRLDLDDLTGAAITLSALGMFGVTDFIAITNPGQASILSIGNLIDTAVVKDGNVHCRKMMSFTLAVDHKVANGAYAANFLRYIIDQLEQPESLI